MTNITLIAAVAENNVIGRYGEIPWEIPEDIGEEVYQKVKKIINKK